MKQNSIILIIDDSAFDRIFFKDAIHEIDPTCECREAINGVEGLKQLRQKRPLPDYIFLDLNMPLINGKECLAEIVKDDELKSIPVIIYSTGDYVDNKDLTSKYGAAYFLSKPWSIGVLPHEIRKALDKASQFRLHL